MLTDHTVARALHPSSAIDPNDLLATIASGLALSAVVEPTTGSQRTWERLLATDAYDAWLIRWPPGTSVGPHDHGGSSGAFAVVHGALVEVVVEPTGSRVVVHTAGGARAFGPDVVHDVANAGPEPAVSVHVYSPPLATMRRYRWTAAEPEAA
jgi:predicted metal-dependent enzyme (double-stranded beta helix superfamily)